MSGKVPCPKCNEPNYPTDTVCLSCGARINAPARPASEPASAPPHDGSMPDRAARGRVIPWIAGGFALIIMVAVAVPLSMRSRGNQATTSGSTTTDGGNSATVTQPDGEASPAFPSPGGGVTPTTPQPDGSVAPATPYPAGGATPAGSQPDSGVTPSTQYPAGGATPGGSLPNKPATLESASLGITVLGYSWRKQIGYNDPFASGGSEYPSLTPKPGSRLVAVRCVFSLKGGQDGVALPVNDLVLSFRGVPCEQEIVLAGDLVLSGRITRAGLQSWEPDVVFQVPDTASVADLLLTGPGNQTVLLAALPELTP